MVEDIWSVSTSVSDLKERNITQPVMKIVHEACYKLHNCEQILVIEEYNSNLTGSVYNLIVMVQSYAGTVHGIIYGLIQGQK